MNQPRKKTAKSLHDYSPQDYHGKRVLVRMDLNLPFNQDGSVIDDTRLREVLPTLRMLLACGAKPILLSHMGRPSGRDPTCSLVRLQPHLHGYLRDVVGYRRVLFSAETFGDSVRKKTHSLAAGEVLLLENLRFHAGECKAEDAFAKALASLGDCYVNDAFSCSHRAHASIVSLPAYFQQRCMGLAMQREIQCLQSLLDAPPRPFVFVLGGCKVSDKLRLIERFLPHVDHFLIGGGMAYTLLAQQGGKIGDSICEKDAFAAVAMLFEQARKHGAILQLPVDSLILSPNGEQTKEVDSLQIPRGWRGLDIGSRAVRAFHAFIMRSRCVLWNGPLGFFEQTAFSSGTQQVATAISRATTQRGVHSVIGGGDTLAAVRKFGLQGTFSYASTGGGAMLSFLASGTLCGLQALEDQ